MFGAGRLILCETVADEGIETKASGDEDNAEAVIAQAKVWVDDVRFGKDDDDDEDEVNWIGEYVPSSEVRERLRS